MPSIRVKHTPSSVGLTTMEGSQVDIVLRSEGEPGLIGSALSLPRSERGVDGSQEHHDDVVEHLDVIDPQVSTVSSLTNAANSILIPPMSWYSRKPVLVLSPLASSEHMDQLIEGGRDAEQFEDSLDRHVEDVLMRPSKVRRTLMGIWSFLKTPMGVITAIYGFLVVFWGAAIVIFIAKIINFHNPNLQGFWIEVSSQVTNGLFTLTGIGLIPTRILDTYRVRKIWHYKYKTKQLRAKAGLPELLDQDDLPNPIYDPNYVHVLTDEEQEDLHYQQVQFQNHQTWYRSHGSETHRAFPINTALLICLFNDGNSFFQIILCGVMWGFDRFQRPPWAVLTLIPCCFLCGITAAVLIWRGGEKTKRKQEVEERLRVVLAGELPGAPDDPAPDTMNPVSQSTTPCLTEKVKAIVTASPTNQDTEDEKICKTEK
ncbi:hypothetical protein BDN72DRAFT_885343 [Pluteus cervinus]|uniref:Uncharacterized protein n=1 Tax=Pluteus cervinus TaxID=181527 RepID=A0ACD3BD82_9AGAR|nr:hypothetical protein BDN72DRAFT_885343 [Pluteus cervinus]